MMAAETEAWEDGLGQSWLTDLLWWAGFMRRRRIAVAWQTPDAAAWALWRSDPRLDGFGDLVYAVARPAPERWLVVERDWFGWPDPPRFAFFALGSGGSIVCAQDFNVWPARWRAPEGANP